MIPRKYATNDNNNSNILTTTGGYRRYDILRIEHESPAARVTPVVAPEKRLTREREK